MPGDGVEVLFQTQLDYLASSKRIGEEYLQTRPASLCFRGQRVVAQLRDVQARDSEIGGNAQIKFSQRSFADVQLDLGFDGGLGFTEVIEQELRNGQFGKNILRL